MKILKVWPFWQDDLKYHDHYLAEEMRRTGHETVFLAPNRAESSLAPFVSQSIFPRGEYDRGSYRVVCLSSINFFGKFIVTDIRLVSQWLRKDFDVVHIFGISNFISFLVLTLLILRRHRPLIVFNDHNHPEDHKSSALARIYHGLFRRLYDLYSPMVAEVIVPNLPSKHYLMRRYQLKDDSKIKIIPLGFNQEVFNLHSGPRNGESMLVLGFAGKIYPEKRLEVLLDAVQRFPEGQIRLVIAGNNLGELSDYQCDLRARVKDMGLRNVEVRPFIRNPADLAKFYAYIDVAVFPGSLSITTLEASGCGTPVVLFRSTEGLEDRVDNGRGELFDDLEGLVKILDAYLVAKRDASINHAEICHQSQRYSWKVISNRYLDEYRSLMAF